MVEFSFANQELEFKNNYWKTFLQDHFKSENTYKIHFEKNIPTFFDSEGRKFSIDFLGDMANYNKVKSSIHKEPLAKALGSGAKGLKLLDLSAGLGVDSFFLYQLGFSVTAVERNALVYMALQIASEQIPQIKVVFSDSLQFLDSLKPGDFDVAYFDPMFPEKKKSALPKQEMVLFKNLVGQDEDALAIVDLALEKKLFKRFAVKRPKTAPSFRKPAGSIEGKMIRYDIYGL